ncbi:hypothetical protein PlfCFBP13513_18520 [Plantibacter flavus]|uniref:HutD/Ves family protein n=1 Tax=Plantibacter flavus TaxID=150123 RepID=UPI0010C15CBA|nr:HutD family protein [Plantibacter flavus]TKJ95791.1 hypothetical protein PlfCFBP13513_18520 [Plantibacter flavus]
MSDATEGHALMLLPADRHRSYRWRNGLGTATEIAVEAVGLRTDGGLGGGDAPAAPGWTLSIATVESDVAFSSFPGVDRQLMALSSGGLGLVIDGERVELDRWQVAAFDGASAVSSRGVVGPTLDLNLMVSRDRFRGSLEVGVVDGSRLVTTPPGATTFVVLLDGLLSAEGPGLGPGALQRHDTLRLEAGTLSLTGDATIALARILPHL